MKHYSVIFLLLCTPNGALVEASHCFLLESVSQSLENFPGIHPTDFLPFAAVAALLLATCSLIPFSDFQMLINVLHRCVGLSWSDVLSGGRRSEARLGFVLHVHSSGPMHQLAHFSFIGECGRCVHFMTHKQISSPANSLRLEFSPRALYSIIRCSTSWWHCTIFPSF